MLSSLHGLCVFLPFLVFSLFLSLPFFSPASRTWRLGWQGVMSECLGSRPAWPYLFARTAWCLGLSSSSFVFLFCLSSVHVRTAGCLSPSPSLVLAEALHVGFFFFYFSSLAIHSASFVSSVLLDDVASCRLEFCKSRLSVCTVCRWLELGGYVQCDSGLVL